MLNRPVFNASLMQDDMASRGWLQVDLAEAARVSAMTVSRFMRGDVQSARTAAKLASALGHSPERYLVRSTEPTTASPA